LLASAVVPFAKELSQNLQDRENSHEDRLTNNLKKLQNQKKSPAKDLSSLRQVITSYY